MTPRPPANAKYVSPPPGNFVSSPSTAKKPVIKFTYGQPSQPSKIDPHRSTVSKQSEVKSPSKNLYSQSHAVDKSKKIVSPPESVVQPSKISQSEKKETPKPEVKDVVTPQ